VPSAPDGQLPDEAQPSAEAQPPGEAHTPPTAKHAHEEDLSPTAELWRRRTRLSPAIGSASALLGVEPVLLADATAISLAASEEAVELLDGMELRVRTLKTTVATSAERCVYSVRGPILWSETITARANALGNEDVFVCMTTARSFDTVENRILVAALEAIARAGKALRGPTGERVDPAEVDRIAAVAEEAAHWRNNPRLADIKGGRLNGRGLARLRGGHRMARLAPVLAVRRRVAEPFIPEDVHGLADDATRAYHGFVLQVLDVVSRAAGRSGHLTLSDDGLWSGQLSFRHPAGSGDTVAGLALRGRPILPPAALLEGAPWADRLPVDGLRIEEDDDVDRLAELVSPAHAPRRH
jgi:hypothetical protein